MELAVATPMHMMASVSAGTDSVVWVANNIQTMPASAAGNAVTITNGSAHDWKLTTTIRSNNMPANALFMVCTWPSRAMDEPLGRVAALFLTTRWMSEATAPRSRSCV